MEDNIEKIIADSVVPEMEYVKTKRTGERGAVEVPEVVLPKTRVEVYREAKGRLGQKTSAVSKRTGKTEKKTAEKTVTVTKTRAPERTTLEPVRTRRKPESETVATVEPITLTQLEYPKSARKTKERVALIRIVDEPKWVGEPEDMIPFAWRIPLVDVNKPSRLYKMTMREARERALLLPVPKN